MKIHVRLFVDYACGGEEVWSLETGTTLDRRNNDKAEKVRQLLLGRGRESGITMNHKRSPTEETFDLYC